MNLINIIGRMTKNPELRNSSGGKKFVAFTVAVHELIGGTQQTQFVPCIAWEKTAENIVNFLKKGSLICVEGSLKVRQENTDGKINQIIIVNSNRVHFLSGNNSENQKSKEPEYELIDDYQSDWE